MTKLRACPAFSLAIDESTDKSDAAQLMIYVRYFNEGVSEDFLCLIPLIPNSYETTYIDSILRRNPVFYSQISFQNVSDE